jgi:hypothetical protein
MRKPFLVILIAAMVIISTTALRDVNHISAQAGGEPIVPVETIEQQS